MFVWKSKKFAEQASRGYQCLQYRYHVKVYSILTLQKSKAFTVA